MSSHEIETDAKAFLTPLLQQKSKVFKQDQLTKKTIQKRPAIDMPRFTERGNLNCGPLEYPRKGTDPGMVLIFNQENFDDQNIRMRRGSSRDVNDIVICFQRLGFNIYEENIFTDLTADQILSTIDAVVEEKEALKATNCLIVFLLTHGNSNEEVHVKDTILKSRAIWEKFETCEELKHKPKMFIFQACKGGRYASTTGESNNNDDPSKILDISSFPVSLEPDMLFVYSTTEGNVSFRNTLRGTWFIQELCKNFSSYGRRDDVLTMITRTIKCVCGNYYRAVESTNPDTQNQVAVIQKQMPVFISTLTKKFYLNRNKDRNLLLSMLKEIHEINQTLKEISKKIDNHHNRC